MQDVGVGLGSSQRVRYQKTNTGIKNSILEIALTIGNGSTYKVKNVEVRKAACIYRLRNNFPMLYKFGSDISAFWYIESGEIYNKFVGTHH